MCLRRRRTSAGASWRSSCSFTIRAEPTLEEPVKQNWERDLKALGYQRVIFLRGSNKTRQVNGLTLLEGQPAPAWSAEK